MDRPGLPVGGTVHRFDEVARPLGDRRLAPRAVPSRA